MNKLLYGSIRPEGWLRRQLEIQAKGLSGNLDLIWPDVRDSAWIGGDREGWERVPYWLDGFIPLAHLLQDQDLIARADRYVQCIVDRQQPDGWICPCEGSERRQYDVWVVFLICKVLAMYADLTGDKRAEEAVEKARENAVSGDVISLSPASASFDKYKDFEERGRHFKNIVKGLK